MLSINIKVFCDLFCKVGRRGGGKLKGCRNPSLGLATKAKGLQGCGPRERPESHITCSQECQRV